MIGYLAAITLRQRGVTGSVIFPRRAGLYEPQAAVPEPESPSIGIERGAAVTAPQTRREVERPQVMAEGRQAEAIPGAPISAPPSMQPKVVLAPARHMLREDRAASGEPLDAARPPEEPRLVPRWPVSRAPAEPSLAAERARPPLGPSPVLGVSAEHETKPEPPEKLSPPTRIAREPRHVPAIEPIAPPAARPSPILPRVSILDVPAHIPARQAEPGAVPAEREVVVTIGRIEVRAVTSPAAPVRARGGSEIMSLEDYLRQRVQGAR